MLTGINHITLTVSNLDTSIDFYIELLGFTGLVKWQTGAYLSLQEVWLCLTLGEPDSKQDYSHIAFSVEKQHFVGFSEKLKQMDVRQWQENKSEGDSFYFLDPDGHKLEVHVGGLVERLQSLRNSPYKELKWL